MVLITQANNEFFTAGLSLRRYRQKSLCHRYFMEDYMRKFFVISLAVSLALALASGPVLAQAPKAAEKQPAPAAKAPAPPPQTLKLTITGKIAKEPQGYIIQGQKPPELFTILNPNPQVLDKLVKSGKTVTIEAVSVMGDNVNVEKIDGKPYKEAQGGKSMGK